MCTISSDGKIFVYDLASLPAPSESAEEAVEMKPKVEYDTKGTRLICVSVADGEVVNVNEEQVCRKRKRLQEENKSEEEEEEWTGAQEQEDEGQEAEAEGDESD